MIGTLLSACGAQASGKPNARLCVFFLPGSPRCCRKEARKRSKTVPLIQWISLYHTMDCLCSGKTLKRNTALRGRMKKLRIHKK